MGVATFVERLDSRGPSTIDYRVQIVTREGVTAARLGESRSLLGSALLGLVTKIARIAPASPAALDASSTGAIDWDSYMSATVNVWLLMLLRDPHGHPRKDGR